MRVGIIGTGHVGLVTCAALSAVGHNVVGTDQDREKMDLLGRGRAPFFEPGLEELIARCTREGTLSFSPDPADAVRGAEVVLISVGTPPRASGEANLVAVERAAREIARLATNRCVIVEKSTVPTGTAQRLRRVLAAERPDLAGGLDVVSNPEFLREGRALEDALRPERVLIGAETPWAFGVMRRLYAPLIEQGSRLIETDLATAELAKHACNAFLALKVSFVNALARICERADADISLVAEVMGTDARIGDSFLRAGLGYGGSCFPKDLKAFERLAGRLGYDFPLLREIERINDEAVHAAFDKIGDALWNVEDKRIALLGLSFKPGTDDVRFSPALSLARLLIEAGATVAGYDPRGAANAKAEVPGIELASDPYDAAAGAHCLVSCTEWTEFDDLDLARIKELMAQPVVVDGRNIFDPDAMQELGFSYYPTGRPRIVS